MIDFFVENVDDKRKMIYVTKGFILSAVKVFMLMDIDQLNLLFYCHLMIIHNLKINKCILLCDWYEHGL